MSRRFIVGVLVVSCIWWLFPDLFPGPIDDLIAFVVSVVSGISLLATKAKAAQNAVELLTSDSTTQSS